MAKETYHGANLDMTDTFAGLVTRVNDLIHDTATVQVTTTIAPVPNTNNGGVTVGNAHIQGTMSANTLSTPRLTGGTIQHPANLTVASNAVFQNTALFQANVTTTANAYLGGANVAITANVNITNAKTDINATTANVRFTTANVAGATLHVNANTNITGANVNVTGTVTVAGPTTNLNANTVSSNNALFDVKSDRVSFVANSASVNANAVWINAPLTTVTGNQRNKGTIQTDDLRVEANTVAIGNVALATANTFVTVGGRVAGVVNAAPNASLGSPTARFNGQFGNLDIVTATANLVAANTLTGNLNWSNVTSKPSPVIGIKMIGGVEANGSVTLSQMNSANITLTVNVLKQTIVLGQDTEGNFVSALTGGDAINITNASNTGATDVVVSHAVTTGIANTKIQLSGGQVITGLDVKYDKFGHVQSLTAASATLDGRYANSAFNTVKINGVDLGSDGIGGTLNVQTGNGISATSNIATDTFTLYSSETLDQLLNKGTTTTKTISLGGLNMSATANIDINGNANTAAGLQTARTIALSGDATGEVVFKGTTNVTLPVSVNKSQAAGANTIAQRTASGGLVAATFNGSGQYLTNIPSGEINGVIPDGNLPSNIVRNTVAINSANGLIGGGNLSANRNLSVQAGLGLVANATGVHVLAGNGLVANNTAVTVGQGDGINVTGSAVAVDATVVRTTGTQEISGSKNFTGATVTVSGSGNKHLWFRDADGRAVGIVYHDNNNSDMLFRNYTANGTHTAAEVRLRQSGEVAFSGKLVGDGGGLNNIQAAAIQGVITDDHLPTNIVHTDRTIATGNGLTGGGNLTANRTLSVVAGNGLAANSTGIHVVPGLGLLANASHVYINAGNGIVANNTHLYIQTGNGMTANATHLFVNAGDGLTAGSTGLSVNSTIARTDRNEVFSANLTIQGSRLIMENPSGSQGLPAIRLGNEADGIGHNSGDDIRISLITSASRRLSIATNGDTRIHNNLFVAGEINGSGAGLHSIPASAIGSGTIAAARLPRATTTDAVGASNNEKVITPLTANIFYNSKTFVSGWFDIKNNHQELIMHNLGSYSLQVTIQLKCKTSDMRWAVGDIIQIASTADPSGQTEGTAAWFTSQNGLTVFVGANGPGEYTTKPGGSDLSVSGGGLTATRWDMRVLIQKLD